jgi:hypothetical protein
VAQPTKVVFRKLKIEKTERFKNTLNNILQKKRWALCWKIVFLFVEVGKAMKTSSRWRSLSDNPSHPLKWLPFHVKRAMEPCKATKQHIQISYKCYGQKIT